MTSQDPLTSKSHTFQDHMEMCGRVWERDAQCHARVPRGRTVSYFLAFFGLFPGLSLFFLKLESTLTNKNNKKLRYLIADLKTHVKLALLFELTRQNRHVHAGLPRRRSTTQSPTVRLNSKLSKATLTSRTEKIRRQNIRLNSRSFTLKERSDSDDNGQAKKFEETTKVTCW